MFLCAEGGLIFDTNSISSVLRFPGKRSILARNINCFVTFRYSSRDNLKQDVEAYSGTQSRLNSLKSPKVTATLGPRVGLCGGYIPHCIRINCIFNKALFL